MTFRTPGEIEKETFLVPKGEVWYNSIRALPNRLFGEQTLVAAGMSDRWKPESLEVTIYVEGGVESIFFKAFKASLRTIEVRQVRPGEQTWYNRIRVNFIYPHAELFTAPIPEVEGAHILNPRPFRAVTPSGRKLLYFPAWSPWPHLSMS
ncbi:hypothetical protein Hanom_Chr05g00420741 [Helianthus anomalus]